MNSRKVLIVVLAITMAAAAQSFRGGILGTVSDTTGAAIAGAKVTATSGDTGLIRDTVTDAEGNYNFTELPLGKYSVRVSKEGFRTQTVTNIVVAVEGPSAPMSP